MAQGEAQSIGHWEHKHIAGSPCTPDKPPFVSIQGCEGTRWGKPLEGDPDLRAPGLRSGSKPGLEFAASLLGGRVALMDSAQFPRPSASISNTNADHVHPLNLALEVLLPRQGLEAVKATIPSHLPVVQMGRPVEAPNSDAEHTLDRHKVSILTRKGAHMSSHSADPRLLDTRFVPAKGGTEANAVDRQIVIPKIFSGNERVALQAQHQAPKPLLPGNLEAERGPLQPGAVRRALIVTK